MTTTRPATRSRRDPDERLLINAVRRGVITRERVDLYRQMIKRDPVGTRSLLVRLHRVIQ